MGGCAGERVCKPTEFWFGVSEGGLVGADVQAQAQEWARTWARARALGSLWAWLSARRWHGARAWAYAWAFVSVKVDVDVLVRVHVTA